MSGFLSNTGGDAVRQVLLAQVLSATSIYRERGVNLTAISSQKVTVAWVFDEPSTSGKSARTGTVALPRESHELDLVIELGGIGGSREAE